MRLQNGFEASYFKVNSNIFSYSSPAWTYQDYLCFNPNPWVGIIHFLYVRIAQDKFELYFYPTPDQTTAQYPTFDSYKSAFLTYIESELLDKIVTYDHMYADFTKGINCVVIYDCKKHEDGSESEYGSCSCVVYPGQNPNADEIITP